MGIPSTVIFSCGCSAVYEIPGHVKTTTIGIKDPDSDETHQLDVVRLSDAPPVFLESGKERPHWAKSCHPMVWFDIRICDEALWQDFDHLFKPFRDKFGPYVPQCWLPDILRGAGRFYGLWRYQTPTEGRTIRHLKLLDPLEEAPARSPRAPEPGTPSAT